MSFFAGSFVLNIHKHITIEKATLLLIDRGLNWATAEKLLWICGRGWLSKGFVAAQRQTVTVLKFFPGSRTESNQ